MSRQKGIDMKFATMKVISELLEERKSLLERVQNDFHKMYLDEMKRLEDLSIYGDSEISEDTLKTLKKEYEDVRKEYLRVLYAKEDFESKEW